MTERHIDKEKQSGEKQETETGLAIARALKILVSFIWSETETERGKRLLRATERRETETVTSLAIA